MSQCKRTLRRTWEAGPFHCETSSHCDQGGGLYFYKDVIFSPSLSTLYACDQNNTIHYFKTPTFQEYPLCDKSLLHVTERKKHVILKLIDMLVWYKKQRSLIGSFVLIPQAKFDWFSWLIYHEMKWNVCMWFMCILHVKIEKIWKNTLRYQEIFTLPEDKVISYGGCVTSSFPVIIPYSQDACLRIEFPVLIPCYELRQQGIFLSSGSVSSASNITVMQWQLETPTCQRCEDTALTCS